MKNVFAYIRVSGKGQVEGDGPDRQKDIIGAFCLKHGLALLDGNIYFEPGVSGTVDGLDRPAFTRLLFSVERLREAGEEVTGIVVERLDRLARDLMVSELLLAECRKRNLKVFSSDQGELIDMAADGDDPTRILIRQLMGALAQWEKSMLVKKLRMSRDRQRQLVGRCEGRKPFGTRPGEKHCIDLLLQLCSTGETPASIAAELNRVGFVTRNGKPWTRNYVVKRLKSTI